MPEQQRGLRVEGVSAMTVLLSVLRIIGLVLLILLGIILFLLLLILFMPIVYWIRGEKQEEIKAEAKVRWLFGLLRVSFVYPDPGQLQVKVLCFTVYDSTPKEPDGAGSDESAKEAVSPIGSHERTENNDTAVNTGRTDVTENADVTGNADDNISADDNESAEENRKAQEHAEAWREVEARLRREKPESKFDKIRYTIRSTCDKIKDTWENISYYKEVLTDNETRQLLDHALLRMGKILKSIRPRKLEGNLLFGTGSPDTTGYVLGVYGMLSPFVGNSFLLTPDFEDKVLEGRIYIAGHIMLVKILWQGILLVLDKKLWHFISKVKKEKKHGK